MYLIAFDRRPLGENSPLLKDNQNSGKYFSDNWEFLFYYRGKSDAMNKLYE